MFKFGMAYFPGRPATELIKIQGAHQMPEEYNKSAPGAHKEGQIGFFTPSCADLADVSPHCILIAIFRGVKTNLVVHLCTFFVKAKHSSQFSQELDLGQSLEL